MKRMDPQNPDMGEIRPKWKKVQIRSLKPHQITHVFDERGGLLSEVLRERAIGHPETLWAPGKGELARAVQDMVAVVNAEDGDFENDMAERQSDASRGPPESRHAQVSDHRSETGEDRTGIVNSIGMSSSHSVIFYPSEFLNQSDADLRPEATRGSCSSHEVEKIDDRHETDFMGNRASRVLPLGLLQER